MIYPYWTTYYLLLHQPFSYSKMHEMNEIHWSFWIIVVISPRTTFRRMSPHFIEIDKNMHYSGRNNLHILPSLLLDKLYQWDRGLKSLIDRISEAKAFRTLVRKYVSPTIGSELSWSCKLNEWSADILSVIGRYFVTRTSLEYNVYIIIEYQPITEKIVLYLESRYDDI